MVKPAIVWLRKDLRLTDNVALCKSLEAGFEPILVYVIDAEDLKDVPYGGRPGYFRIKFLLESLADLRRSAQAVGSDLVIRVGDPAQVIVELAESTGSSKIYCQHEYGPRIRAITDDVNRRLPGSLQQYHTCPMLHPDDLPFRPEQLPQHFTAFRNKVEPLSVRPSLPAPLRLPCLPAGLEPGPLPGEEVLGVAPEKVDARTAVPFEGGESTGKARVQDYLFGRRLISSYKETRNQLLKEFYSTKFSMWLAFGCLSPRTIYHQIRKYEAEIESNESTYWVIFELLWRDYFKFIGFNHYTTEPLPLEGIKGRSDIKYRNSTEDFRAWTEGRTGDAFVDANMIEMRKTGFMSNRGRQNVASFLIKDLLVDWRWGAAWFHAQLIDSDYTANYGNWMYQAGVGNDPRENRKFNTAKQAHDYDKLGQYRRTWLPEGRDWTGSKCQYVARGNNAPQRPPKPFHQKADRTRTDMAKEASKRNRERRWSNAKDSGEI